VALEEPSISPSGQSFTGDYTLEFDALHKYNGLLNGGGNGSTQVTGAGIGTAGTTPQWAVAVLRLPLLRRDRRRRLLGGLPRLSLGERRLAR
jgi:hypothetical protein